MGIQFLGPHTPPGFTKQAHLNVVNGSKAVAPKQIFDNQAWLATQDVGAGTLFTSPTGVLAFMSEEGTSWPLADPAGTLNETGPIEQRIRLSPYAAYVDIWVWCVRDYATASVNNPTIYVECVETGDVRSTTLISGGTDSTGKTASYPASDEARWVRLEGVPVGSTQASDGAVLCRQDQSSDHKPATLRVWVSNASVRIYTVCYKVVPRKGVMSSWDGAEPFAFYRIAPGEQITVPSMILSDPQAFSISFWFRYRSLPPVDKYARLLTTLIDGTPVIEYNILEVNDRKELRLSASLEDVAEASPGVWHHFAAIVNTEANVWVDGVLYGGDAWGTIDPGGDISFKFGLQTPYTNAVYFDIANICVFDSGAATSIWDLWGGGNKMKFDPRNPIGSWLGAVPQRQYITGRNLTGEIENSGDGGAANLTSSSGVVQSIAF